MIDLDCKYCIIFMQDSDKYVLQDTYISLYYIYAIIRIQGGERDVT